MVKKDDILQVLKALRPELSSQYKVKEIGLFGSFVRGEQDEESDVDILVTFKEDASLLDLVSLERFLEEKLGREVDVVSRNALKKELRDPILKEVILL